jgi:hypothetical protein
MRRPGHAWPRFALPRLLPTGFFGDAEFEPCNTLHGVARSPRTPPSDGTELWMVLLDGPRTLLVVPCLNGDVLGPHHLAEADRQRVRLARLANGTAFTDWLSADGSTLVIPETVWIRRQPTDYAALPSQTATGDDAGALAEAPAKLAKATRTAAGKARKATLT